MIPKLHYISSAVTKSQHLDQVQRACSSGIELIQLDLTTIQKSELIAFVTEVKHITDHFQTRLILNEHYKIARELKTDGVYFKDTNTIPDGIRTHLHSWQLIGGSAFNLEEGETLIKTNADYMVLGPFRSTSENERTLKAMGADGLSLVKEALKTETPILAFGAIGTDDVSSILETGISGLALSQEISSDFNAIGVYHKLLGASSTSEQRHTFK